MNDLKTQFAKTRFVVLCTATLLFCLAATAHATVTAPSFGDLLIGLDGDDITTSGAEVTSWNDQAGVGGYDEDFVEDFNTGSTANPTLLTGVTMPNGTSHNVVDFAGGPSDYGAHIGSGQTLRLLPNADLDHLDVQSWYMVVRFDDPTRNGGGQIAYGLNTDQHDEKMSTGVTGGNVGQIARDGGGFQDVNTGNVLVPAVAGKWYLLSGRFNMTENMVNEVTGGGHSFRAHDETGLLTSNTRVGMEGPPGVHDQSILGNRGDGHFYRFMDGAIAEFLFYNDILDNTEQDAVWDYLLGKYFNAPTAPDGDFNGDLVVDGADFLLWQQNPAVGDLADWQTNYGYGAAAAAVGAVPEPGSLALLALGSCCLINMQRRRRS